MKRADVRAWAFWALGIFIVCYLLRPWFQGRLPSGLRRPIFIAAGFVAALAILSTLEVRRLERLINVEAWRAVAAKVALVALALFVLTSPDITCHVEPVGSKTRLRCPMNEEQPIGL